MSIGPFSRMLLEYRQGIQFAGPLPGLKKLPDLPPPRKEVWTLTCASRLLQTAPFTLSSATESPRLHFVTPGSFPEHGWTLRRTGGSLAS